MTLLYFAWLRQRLEKGQEEFPLPDHVRTVADLLKHLRERGAPYAETLADEKTIRAAVNQQHVKLDAAISDKDEVALFPPVTGG